MTRVTSTLSSALTISHVRRPLARSLFRMTLVAADALMLALAFYLAYIVRFDLQFTLAPEIMPAQSFYTRLVLILIPIWLAIFALSRLYDFHFLLGGTAEYAHAFNACTIGVMTIVLFSFFEPKFVVARAWLLAAWLLSFLLVCAARFALRRVAYGLRHWGFFVSPAIIVGINSEALALGQTLRHSVSSGVQIVGFVDSDVARDGENRQRECSQIAPLLGSIDELADIARRLDIQEVIVATTALHREQLLDLHEDLATLPHTELHLSSGLFEVLTTGVKVRTWGFVPLISLNRLRLDPFEVVIKTALDYVLALITMLAAAPVMAVLALAVKLDSPGPVLHRRRVLGMGGKAFDAFKFRTMVVNGEEVLARYPQLAAELKARHKLKHDPRITRVGRWLRRFSLDELPQLFNVLLGQMSLVGPRMITAEEGDEYGRLKLNLLTVKPGITGLWQVSGRSDVSYEERVRLDMHYIRTYSIWRDLQILFVQTPPAVLRSRGAY